MADKPKYRKASEKTIKAGKGKSTDELSFKDALEYFQSRSKETGSKQFRYKGEVYGIDGKKAEKPSGKPAKAEEKPARPKANPARKPGGARPEPGRAGNMPAAKPKEESKASAGLPVLGAAAAAATAGRKPTAGKPYNPTYSGRGKAPEGFQGRFATEVARPRAAGGARLAGGNVARGLRGPGGGAIARARDPLMLNFNKGGLVKKPAKTYKK